MDGEEAALVARRVGGGEAEEEVDCPPDVAEVLDYPAMAAAVVLVARGYLSLMDYAGASVGAEERAALLGEIFAGIVRCR